MFRQAKLIAVFATIFLAGCTEEEAADVIDLEIEEMAEKKPSPEEIASFRKLEAEITASDVGKAEHLLCPVTLGIAKGLAQTVSAPFPRTDPEDDRCESDPQACWKSCQVDVGWACRDLANLLENKLEDVTPPLEVDRRLYARACALGEANACTNRAAGIVNARADYDPVEPLSDERRAQCTMIMYEAACGQSEYWGCAQMGIESGEDGHESVRDLERSKTGYRKSCQINAREEGGDASHC